MRNSLNDLFSSLRKRRLFAGEFEHRWTNNDILLAKLGDESRLVLCGHLFGIDECHTSDDSVRKQLMDHQWIRKQQSLHI